MTQLTHGQLLRALGGDEELISRLIELGLVERQDDGYSPEEVERALVSFTLVRELGVNWEGLEIILRLREELLDTHRQVACLITLLKGPHSPSFWGSPR